KSAKGQDLVDKACASFELLEKDYFSCSYLVNGVKFWINHERRISKQIKNFVWNFKFEVKFYPSDPNIMSEDLTRYQLFLQVRTDVYNGLLPCSFVTYCLLGSLAAQSEYGDYDPQELGQGVQYLADSAPYAPIQLQTEEMLEKICELHKNHRGIPPAEAELTYLENAKLLALYGVDMHKARDENHSEVSVGVCCQGLNVYKEKLRLHRFPWAKILKIAYKRNCFFIKIRPGEKEKNEPQTLTYKLTNHTMAKRLWKTAVEHHSFFRFGSSFIYSFIHSFIHSFIIYSQFRHHHHCRRRFNDRLKEPEPPKRGMFPLFGSKFRYSGRTQFQTRSESTNIDRKTPTIDRAASRKYARDVVAKNYETEGEPSLVAWLVGFSC
ncbi:hypothetical protein HELRODRAFT_92323, partial [Helobdella robusta]|uniref:FERM domain-containing protein n=1 Tax=Helobdella robusta TaxID=6412 RepID=T1G8E4_HELRO